MSWMQRLFGANPIPLENEKRDAIGNGFFYKKQKEESPYRTRTVFDMKFGRPYNTGPFHTKLPNKK